MIALKDNTYQYSTSNLLGRGTFGEVFRCIRTTDKKEFALKSIDKSKLQQYGEYLFEALEREIATQTIATQSGIPFYVGLYDNFEDEKTIFMVMELCEKSLLGYVDKVKVTENICLDYIYQIGLGLDYLHSIGICHRDIKTENVLIKDNVLKIADFGFATQSKILSTHLGTKPYMSPEFFISDNDEEYTPKIDVWALNTVFYNLLTKKYYFFSPNPNEMEKQIKKKEFIIEANLSHLSSNTQKLLISGYIKDPNKRPTMREYISHPAFDEVRKRYMDYPPNKKTSTLQDMNFDKLVKDDRLSLANDNTKIIIAFLLNYRNNIIVYSRLATVLQQRQFSKILVFLLVKKHLQNLSCVLCFLKDKKFPSFGPFLQLTIDKNGFDEFLKSTNYQQMCSLYLSDINRLGVRYPQLYKDLLNATKNSDELPLYDLNVDYKKEIINCCSDLNEKCKYIISMKPSTELGKISNLMQLVLLYEGKEERRAVVTLNKFDA